MGAHRKGDGVVRKMIKLDEKSYDKLISICMRKNQIAGAIVEEIANKGIDDYVKDNGGKLK